jgi:dTDP-4-dehydrorhamnose reductase
MRVLILGASGLLGHTLYRRWRDRDGWEVFGTFCRFPVKNLRRLDITEKNAAAELISQLRPDAVVLPASNPFVDYLEKNEAKARALNVAATLSAAEAAFEAGSRFLFFSTDYVFDGALGGYREGDETHPLNVYGRQKREVEERLSTLGSGALICRVAGLFGWEFRPRNFVYQVLSRLRDGQPVRAVTDQIYTPTFVEDIALGAGELLERDAAGLFHLAGPEAVTREAFARRIADAFGFVGADIKGMSTSDMARPDSAARPTNSSLDSSKAAEETGIRFGNVVECLERMRDGEEDWKKYSLEMVPPA